MMRAVTVLAAILLLLVPFATDALGQPALLSLITRILIYAIAAASLNFILGYGGMISFGHAAFFGIGAYTVGILASHADSGEAMFGLIPGSTQMLVTLPAAIIIAGIFAAIIGALSLRTGGVQFIMITLAFAQMLYFFFVSLTPYGGEDGIIMRRTNDLFGLNLRDKTVLYFTILAIAALFFAGLWRLVHSSFGGIIQGIRQNERRMAALGFTPYRYKLYAFTLAGMGAGLAGALMANFLRFTSPDMMHWNKSGELMIMVILGGTGRFFGPLFGAAAFLLLESFLAGWTDDWPLVLGLILLIVVLGTKGGIAGAISGFAGRAR